QHELGPRRLEPRERTASRDGDRRRQPRGQEREDGGPVARSRPVLGDHGSSPPLGRMPHRRCISRPDLWPGIPTQAMERGGQGGMWDGCVDEVRDRHEGTRELGGRRSACDGRVPVALGVPRARQTWACAPSPSWEWAATLWCRSPGSVPGSTWTVTLAACGTWWRIWCRTSLAIACPAATVSSAETTTFTSKTSRCPSHRPRISA